MNKTFVSFAFFILTVLPRIAFGGSTEEETTAIRDLETQQQEAFNQHDAKAYASLFTEDGDCVNVVGWWWRGRPEIEQKLTAAFAFVFSDSVLTITDVDVRFPTSDIAVVHVHWRMTGARTPDGLPKPEKGIQTQLLQKQNGKWLIAAFQNTLSLPEIAFPKGPPASEPQSTAKH
jgi:uncharacterized protein (TIGR02246 family)